MTTQPRPYQIAPECQYDQSYYEAARRLCQRYCAYAKVCEYRPQTCVHFRRQVSRGLAKPLPQLRAPRLSPWLHEIARFVLGGVAFLAWLGLFLLVSAWFPGP